MKKYKVIQPFYKLSDKKNYSIEDDIELSDEEAKNMLKYIDAETFGISTKKTIKEVDKEIKKANQNSECVLEANDPYYWSEADEEEKVISKKANKTKK